MTIDEALKWADTFGPLQSDPPDGDAQALLALAAGVREADAEIERLRAKLTSARETNRRLAPRAFLPSARDVIVAAEREACKETVLAAAAGYAPVMGRPYSKEFEAAYGALLGVAAAL